MLGWLPILRLHSKGLEMTSTTERSREGEGGNVASF